MPHDGFTWTGMSYDNTGSLGHSTWRHVKFVERDARRPAGVGFLVRRLQALRARRLSRSLSDRMRSSARSSAASSFSPTSATAAATASSRARSASSIGGRTTGARSSARSATTGRRPGSSRRARKCVRRSRFSSAISTSCGGAPSSVDRAARARHHRRGRLRSAATRASAARTRSSSCAAISTDYNLPADPEVPTIALRDAWQSAALAGVVMLVVTAIAFLV